MKRIAKVKQHDLCDCGPACLVSICSFHNIRISLAQCRSLASTDQMGTNILGLIEASEKLGLSAKGVRGEYQSLYKIPKPAILHLIIDKKYQHFVVLKKIDRKWTYYMDPRDGRIHKMSHNEFKLLWTGVMLIFLPSKEIKHDMQNNSILNKFIILLKPHKTVLLQAIFGAVIYSILGLCTSLYVKNIIDHVLVDGNINLLNTMSVLMIIFLLCKIYVNIIKGSLILKTGQRIDAILILNYYKHLLKMPQRFFDTMRIGELTSRVNDAVKIRLFINNISLELLVNFFIVFFALALMFLLSWKLGLVVLILIPLYVLIYVRYNFFNKKYLRKNMEHSAELESHVIESINNISTIKQFSVQKLANQKTENRFVDLLKSTYKSGINSIVSLNFTEFIAGGLIIAVLWLGSVLVINQEISPGKLLSFYALVGYFISPLNYIIASNQTIQDALIAADRLFQILDLSVEANADNNFMLPKESISDINFRNVSFRYGSRAYVFNNLNLTIEKGKITAFVGESGSGKTSLITLIQKLYPVNEGSIEIGNYNINYLNNEYLRSVIAVVPQKIDLFSGTIVQNIALGQTDPDMKHLIDVCELLNIRNFIEGLPTGFNTQLGEYGLSLSGGERQKIAIARALYKNPEVLILDEATSSLDSSAESYIKHAINYLRQQNKTIIIIAHRLSTIMDADIIYVLKKGLIIEKGDHQDLIKSKKHYYNMWKQQVMIQETI